MDHLPTFVQFLIGLGVLAALILLVKRLIEGHATDAADAALLPTTKGGWDDPTRR